LLRREELIAKNSWGDQMKNLCAGAAALALSVLAFGGTAGAATKPTVNITITIDVAHPHGPSPVTVTGAFNGSGTDVRTSHVKRRIDRARDVFTFDAGTVTVRDIGRRTSKLDASMCTRTFTERGGWKIARGTGSFAHAKGHGHYKATGTIHGVTSASGCDFSAPTGTIIVTATGKVNGTIS
jgi:hypothetical protein